MGNEMIDQKMLSMEVRYVVVYFVFRLLDCKKSRIMKIIGHADEIRA